MKRFFGFVLAFFIATQSLANPESSLEESTREILSHQHSEQEYRNAVKGNLNFQASDSVLSANSWQPVTDTADFKYVLMSALEEISDVSNLRRLIAMNLPEDVKLVILSSASEASDVYQKYSQWIDPDRLIIAAHNDPYVDNGFWARDSFPIPVTNIDANETSLVSLRYFRTFRSADVLAESVDATISKYNLTYVGGNFMSDSEGNCFAVNSSRLYSMKADDIKSIFGCATVQLLPFVAGIGDVDEVIKLLPNKKVLISAPSYRSIFENLGYTVISLPAPGGGRYRTYANSLAIGKQLFMPVFGTKNDAVATKIYQDLGYNVVAIRSNTLSDSYLGSVHCQTMAYPEIDLSNLLERLGAHQVSFMGS